MLLEKTAQLAIEILQKYKISDYEISLTSGSGMTSLVRLGKVENLQYHLDTSFSVNVYILQKKGQATSVGLANSSISKVIESAFMIAKYTQKDPFNGLAPKELMAFNHFDLDLYHPWDLNATDSINLAKECEAFALEQKYINNSEGAEVSSFKEDVLYANSNGLIASSNQTMHSIGCSPIAKKGNDMQTAHEHTTTLDYKDLETPKTIGIKAAILARQKLGAKSLKTQKCTVVFIAKLAKGLFATLLAALNGSRQYKKHTFLLNSVGQLVLPKSISVLEKPFAKKTIGAQAFDDDGVLKKEQYFIKDGRVQSYILGQYSARQLGLVTTANAGGVSNVVVSSNFNGGLDDITKDIGKTLVVTELMGYGVNSVTGDYSRGACGFFVENGVKYSVAGFTIAGNLKDMLQNIVYVGNDIDYNSNIKVGSVAISNMTVAGNI